MLTTLNGACWSERQRARSKTPRLRSMISPVTTVLELDIVLLYYHVRILPIIYIFHNIACFSFTFYLIGSIISHHDILQLIGSLMLRSTRSEREILAEIAERSFCQVIEQDAFGLRCQLLIEAELCQVLTVTRISPGVTL